MAFSMNCTNKGCCQYQQPYLDPKTSNVFCSLCNKEIQNVSIFAKNQMKASKQFKKKEPESFSVKCNKCNSFNRPRLEKDQVICSDCNKIIDNISPVYKNMLKQNLANAGKDIELGDNIKDVK